MSLRYSYVTYNQVTCNRTLDRRWPRSSEKLFRFSRCTEFGNRCNRYPDFVVYFSLNRRHSMYNDSFFTVIDLLLDLTYLISPKYPHPGT